MLQGFALPNWPGFIFVGDVTRSVHQYRFGWSSFWAVRKNAPIIEGLAILNRQSKVIETDKPIYKSNTAPKFVPHKPLTIGAGYHKTPVLT